MSPLRETTSLRQKPKTQFLTGEIGIRCFNKTRMQVQHKKYHLVRLREE
jgi:hypothetical protein